MTRLQGFLLALFIAAIAFDGNVLVDADISKSMYMDWGNGTAGAFISGDNLQLALDQTSGENYYPLSFCFPPSPSRPINPPIPDSFWVLINFSSS